MKDSILFEIWQETIMRMSVDWEGQGILNDFASTVALI
jgi:hypothetical protein